MKRIIWPILLFGLIGGAFAQDDVFGQMGLSSDQVQDSVLEAVFSASFPYRQISRVFLAAPLSTRITWIRAVFVWARSYTASPEFVQEYRTRRSQAAPAAAAETRSADEELARQQSEFRKQIEEMRKNLKQMPADMRAQMEQTIRDMERQFKEQFDNPQYQALLKQGYQEQARQQTADDQRRRQDFERDYPAEPRRLIARHLQSFLELSGSVDFNARTELRGGLRRFIDPALEAKPGEWKLLYRAGKACVQAARAEAEAWLREIGGR